MKDVMIPIRGKEALQVMREAGARLGDVFLHLADFVRPGLTTLEIDSWVDAQLRRRSLISQTKGYHGYRHVTCVSVNNVLVHGVPSRHVVVQPGDMVKVDVCAAWKGYCADAARIFLVEPVSRQAFSLAKAAEAAFDAGVAKLAPGSRLYDVSSAIQSVIEDRGFGVVRDFCGHGIGRRMHEDPEIPNYGVAGSGPLLREGMAFAIEPMLTEKSFEVFVDASDGWSVFTRDGGLTAHYENTVLLTANGPEVVTRIDSR